MSGIATIQPYPFIGNGGMENFPTIIAGPSTISVGNTAGKTFAGSAPINNGTPAAPGSFVIRNNNAAAPGNNVGAMSLGDITNGIIGQLASYALSNNQQGVLNVGDGGFSGTSRSPTVSGIGGGTKFYG